MKSGRARGTREKTLAASPLARAFSRPNRRACLQAMWFRRDFCNGAKLLRRVLGSKVEGHISDRCSYYVIRDSFLCRHKTWTKLSVECRQSLTQCLHHVYTIRDSSYADTKTISDRAFVHAQERWFQHGFRNGNPWPLAANKLAYAQCTKFQMTSFM